MPSRELAAGETLDALLAEHPQWVVYVSRAECRVCVSLKPKVADLADRYGIPMVYLDAELHPAEAGQRVVFAVPTILVFDEGREVGRFSRNLSMLDVERLFSLMTAA
ncbi:MAG: thioredoxin family protein [Myxococcales bacterium]|nr:thioredoxin family protein [Myxococcales bacterium]